MPSLPGKKEAFVAQIIKDPKRWGFAEAQFINAPQIILSNWPRTWCHVHCPMAHQAATSPPGTPDHEEMTRMLMDYRFGLVIRQEIDGEDSRRDQYAVFSGQLQNLESELRAIGYHKAYCLAATSCVFAPEESRERPCDYPHKNRPTLEAVCIDLQLMLEQINWDHYVKDVHKAADQIFSVVIIQ